MMLDPNLLQLWGSIAEYCEAECGAMYMVESVEDAMEDNVSVLAYCCADERSAARLVAGDFQGNVVIYGGDYAVLNELKPHKWARAAGVRRRNMVTAISNVRKVAAVPLVATGAADGSICVVSTETSQAVCSLKVSVGDGREA